MFPGCIQDAGVVTHLQLSGEIASGAREKRKILRPVLGIRNHALTCIKVDQGWEGTQDMLTSDDTLNTKMQPEHLRMLDMTERSCFWKGGEP